MIKMGGNCFEEENHDPIIYYFSSFKNSIINILFNHRVDFNTRLDVKREKPQKLFIYRRITLNSIIS